MGLVTPDLLSLMRHLSPRDGRGPRRSEKLESPMLDVRGYCLLFGFRVWHSGSIPSESDVVQTLSMPLAGLNVFSFYLAPLPSLTLSGRSCRKQSHAGQTIQLEMHLPAAGARWRCGAAAISGSMARWRPLHRALWALLLWPWRFNCEFSRGIRCSPLLPCRSVT